MSREIRELIYFELVSTLALVIGLVVINLVRPGVGINADVNTLDVRAVASYTTGARSLSTADFLLHVIPDSVVGAFAGGEILLVLLFSVLFGLALARFGDKGKPLVAIIDQVSHALFNVIAIIMRFAPVGAGGAIGGAVARAFAREGARLFSHRAPSDNRRSGY